LEGVAASGAEIDIALYGEIVDRLGRCLQRLGLRRLARDVTPSVNEYLQQNYSSAEPVT
jgi:hypothetical protein